MIATPCPIIDDDRSRWRWRRAIISANGSQQRIIAHWKSETIGKPCCRATTQCKSQMPSQAVQTSCPASHGADHAVAEAFGENLSMAIGGTTDEAPDRQVQFNPSTRTRKLGNHPGIATMNTTRGLTALGASAIWSPTICGNDDRVGTMMHCFNV